ncbi:hypothetical protein SYNPS1DRAFT_30650 [Syncephalis pseudoplumigaleata]|uniref:Uncharacterized protein n=1 Tax=Syncephalis pseudoplumigaleata TaxID=1712513 RepID=A0A4P9YVX3_9FUNG|nr:hypothetical protein SYNPS1DRAFT_30650 [Syncephalis pseudoplumigaleata]|eukprot:RKP23592.1 hypothetical protein SYNPS1DRAFT_30650 [Syncephalis pseudoplumigaleata]
MPHVSPSSSEELTYNAMLQVKVDYFCHSWCQEEATHTQRLLWYRGDLLARYGYSLLTRTRCENLLWRLQYMLLPERIVGEHTGGNDGAATTATAAITTRTARRTISEKWRNLFEKDNRPLIGPVYLTGRRYQAMHRPAMAGCSDAGRLLATSTAHASMNGAHLRGQSATTATSPRPTSVPRVLSDGALSACIQPANMHTAMPATMADASAGALSKSSGDIPTAIRPSASTSLAGRRGRIATLAIPNGRASAASDTQLAAHMSQLPIKSALKRSYGSFVNVHRPVYQPQICRLDHLDLAGPLTPERLRNINESPWDAISPPTDGAYSTIAGADAWIGAYAAE